MQYRNSQKYRNQLQYVPKGIYTAPASSALAFNFTGTYTPPAHNQLEFNFHTPASGDFTSPFLAYGGTGGITVDLTAISTIQVSELAGGTGGFQASLTPNPFVPFTNFNAYSEAGLAGVLLSIEVHLQPLAYGGTGGLNPALTSNPFVPFVNFNFWGGEGGTGSTPLSTSTTFQVEFDGGTGGLATPLNTVDLLSVEFDGGTGGMSMDLHTTFNVVGEADAYGGTGGVTIDLHDQHNPEVDVFGGTGGLSVDLQIAYLLPATFWGGEGGGSFDFTADPFVPFSGFNFWGGEGGLAQPYLATTYHIPLFFWDGAELKPTLTPANQAFLTPNASEGQEASIGLSLAYALFPASFVGGTGGMSVPGMDNIPNDYAYGGTGGLQVTLGTQQSLYPSEMGDSAFCECVFTNEPPQPLGAWQPAGEGPSVNADLSVLPAAKLTVTFRHSYDFRVGLPWVGTDIHMSKGQCCPALNYGNHQLIDMGDGTWDEPDINYGFGHLTIFQADLQVRPRFQVGMYTGENAIVSDPSTTFEISFQDGAAFSATPESIINIRLCKGNFIPDGDHVIIELISTYDDSCNNGFLAVEGSTMQVALEENLGLLNVKASEGASMFFDLTPDPKLLFLAYASENCRVSNPEFTGYCWGGEGGMTFRMLEPSFMAYEGQETQSIPLATEYFIAFSEFGCLDNEYIPTNENGDPIPNPYGPVAVELEIYEHHIKTYCF